jgi:hypothetical protein
MSKLYSSEYKEINLGYLLKIILKSKWYILGVILSVTVLSMYIANTSVPIYESKALLKIGQYYKFERNGDITEKPLDFANELAHELSFLFLKKEVKGGHIVNIITQKNIKNHIEIISQGTSKVAASNIILDLLTYVKNKHSDILLENIERHKIELSNVIKKISAITNKQKSLLSKSNYKDKDYASLLNTLQLMAIINSDLGVGYIGQMLERKEKLELILEEGYNKNSYLVGEISVSDHPIKPRKKIIVLFGLALGLLLSILFVFLKEYFSNKHVKLNYKEN